MPTAKLTAEIYRSKKNRLWYVRIKGANGKKLFGSGDGYERIAGAQKCLNLLQSPAIKMPAEVVSK